MITDYVWKKFSFLDDESVTTFLVLFAIFIHFPCIVLTFVLDILLFPIELIIFFIKRSGNNES
jgi:hypothetical protein